jgi:hypothetical protein
MRELSKLELEWVAGGTGDIGPDPVTPPPAPAMPYQPYTYTPPRFIGAW